MAIFLLVSKIPKNIFTNIISNTNAWTRLLKKLQAFKALGPRRVHIRVEATNGRRLKLAHLVHNSDCREKAGRGNRVKFSLKIHENIFWWCMRITDKLMRKANDQTKQFISGLWKYSFLGRRFTLNLCYCQNSARLACTLWGNGL